MVNHHLRGSPGSVQGDSFNERYDPFVGRGHAPAANVGLSLYLPSSTAPNLALPLGELSPQVTERAATLYVVGSEKALSAQCAHWAPPPEGEARRRSAAVTYEPETLAVNHHLRGSPDSVQGGGRTFCWACRRCRFETATLVVDPRHWVSPGSLLLNKLRKGDVPFVGRGHAPAANVRFLGSSPICAPQNPSPGGKVARRQARRMRNGETFRNGCTRQVPPHQSLPPRGKVARRSRVG